MAQHVTFDRPKRRGRRAQIALDLPVPRVPGDDWPGVPDVPEADVQAAVLDLLRMHPAVAWVERINVGAGRLAHVDKAGAVRLSRFIRFAFEGCSDVVGQLRDGGKFLAVEIKAHGERPTYEQAVFLERVIKNGGVGFVAHKAEDVAVLLVAP